MISVTVRASMARSVTVTSSRVQHPARAEPHHWRDVPFVVVKCGVRCQLGHDGELLRVAAPRAPGVVRGCCTSSLSIRGRIPHGTGHECRRGEQIAAGQPGTVQWRRSASVQASAFGPIDLRPAVPSAACRDGRLLIRGTRHRGEEKRLAGHVTVESHRQVLIGSGWNRRDKGVRRPRASSAPSASVVHPFRLVGAPCGMPH